MKTKHLTIALLTAFIIYGCKKDKEEKKDGPASVVVSGIFSSEQERAIESIVHKYIVSNPMVIVESINNLQQQAMKQQQEKASAIVKENKKELDQTEGFPVQGPATADMTMVMFGDYNCAKSREMFNSISSALDKDKRFRVIFRFLPKDNDISQKSAKIALAVHKQGMFDKFHDAMLKTKGELTSESALNAAKSIAGIDIKKLEEDAASAEISLRIQDNKILAEKLDIKIAPGFVIDDIISPLALNAQQLAALIPQLRTRRNEISK